jgi:hypothetical protein
VSDGEDLADLYGQTRHAAEALHARTEEIHELTKRLEELTTEPRLVRRHEGQSGGEGGVGAG